MTGGDVMEKISLIVQMLLWLLSSRKRGNGQEKSLTPSLYAQDLSVYLSVFGRKNGF